jgi:hypothetical protein
MTSYSQFDIDLYLYQIFIKKLSGISRFSLKTNRALPIMFKPLEDKKNQ